MRRLLILILAALGAFGLSNYLMVWANPEAGFWKRYLDKKSSLLKERRIKKGDEPAVIITGGSSCSFSIIPRTVESEIGIQTYNLGGSYGMGAKYLIANAFQYAKAGDLVVLAIEPSLLDRDLSVQDTPLSLELGVLDGDIDKAVGSPVIDGNTSLRELVTTLRPGSRYLSVMTSKIVLGRDMYRYSMDDWQPGGRLSTESRVESVVSEGKMANELHLSKQAKSILKQTLDYGRKRNIKVCYSMPWAYTKPKASEINRSYNRNFLNEISEIMPVLYDSSEGVRVEAHYYADTILHLTDEGAVERSKELGCAIKKYLKPSTDGN